MKIYTSEEIRNVVVLGHSGCGKTTIMEAALYLTGATGRMGRVEDGNTISDYDAEEIRRRVSVSASIIPVEWQNTKINFIDTPGYFDFVGEVKQALSVADLALIVVSAKSGIEVGTEMAWEYATDLGIPKMIFINGMDDENADFDKTVESLKEKFGVSIAPMQVPIIENSKLTGIVNVITSDGMRYTGGKPERIPMPAGMEDTVDMIRLMIEEAVAETDDALMEKFFSEERFTQEEIAQGLINGIKSGSVTPVVCGAAVNQVGILLMLETIIKTVPSAGKMSAEVTAKKPKTGDSVTLKCVDNEPFAAFVFKTIADPYVGRLSLFRVYSGVIKRDSMLYNPKHDTTEKAGHIYIMRGKEQIEVDEIKAGDIGAIAKLSSTSTQDSLCAKERPVFVKEIKFPVSLLSMAIVPKGKGDEDKISQALSKLSEEDRTLRFEINPETKQSVVYGQGDSQLDVLVNKLKNRYKIEVELITPTIPYREMIKSKIRVQGKYKKQSGGHGQYGDVHMEFEPSGDPTTPYVFEEKIFGGSVPRQYFPAVEKGIQECVKAGPLALYPVVGIKATLVDGSYHPVDSSEMAFKMATTMAFKDGFMKAKPTILEPIAKVEVFVPDDYTGDIMGDMNKRRGRILGMDKVGSKQRIAAEVPMAEMNKYTTDLRSITQGRGTFMMAFDRYEDAPSDVQQKVIEARKKEIEKMKEKE